MRIGRLVGELTASFVERVELGLVLRERAVSARTTPPRRVGIDLEQDGQRPVPQLVAYRWGLDSAAAECDHGWIRQAQRRDRVTLLANAKLHLAALLEQFRNPLAE